MYDVLYLYNSGFIDIASTCYKINRECDSVIESGSIGHAAGI